ncbi:MAG: RNA polymerase sigma factor [Planctomycetes bacterium]|nr:RNA polymerase sigma factor [Planctomycetota bacterium]
MTRPEPVALPAVELPRLRTDLWRFLRWLGADAALADDLTQDALLRLVRQPPRERDPAVLAGWLRTTALRLFARSRGRRREGVPFDDETELLVAWQRWAGQDGGDRRAAALSQCLDQLAPTTRAALDLVYRHRTPLAEVAAAVGLRLAGLKSLLARARTHLHGCIEHRLEENR